LFEFKLLEESINLIRLLEKLYEKAFGLVRINTNSFYIFTRTKTACCLADDASKFFPALFAQKLWHLTQKKNRPPTGQLFFPVIK